MSKEIIIPNWIKDHPAPAFGTWGNEDAPGVLRLDRHGSLDLATGREPGLRSEEEHFDAALCFSIPPRVRGDRLWKLLNGGGQALLQQIHAGHSVEIQDNHERRGELTEPAEEARQELQGLLDDLGEDDEADVVARHELPEHLFDSGAGLTGRWPGDEPLDAAVARLLAELDAESKRNGTFFQDLNAAELRRVLLAEVADMAEDEDRQDELGPEHHAALAAEQAEA
jgi:hypothetical protein